MFIHGVPKVPLWTHSIYTVVYIHCFTKFFVDTYYVYSSIYIYIYIVYLRLFVDTYYVHSVYMYCVPKDPLWTHRTSKVVCVCVCMRVCVVYTRFWGRHILYTQLCIYIVYTKFLCVHILYTQLLYKCCPPWGLLGLFNLLNHRTPIVKSVPINQVTPIY